MATLERTRTEQESQQHDSAPSTFVPAAVPSVFLPPLASLDQAQQQEDDLIDLGQERLFSGTRTARQQLPAGHEQAPPAEAVASNGRTADSGREYQDLLTSLGAARQAFLFALSGVLGQYFPPPETATNSSTRADPFADPASAASAAAQPPHVLLSRLLDSLRSSSSPLPPSILSSHLRASPAMLSIERSSPLLASPRSASSSSGAAQPLLEELQVRVDAAASGGVLPPIEAEVARALTRLLTCIERLATISCSDSSDDSSCPAAAPSSAARVTPPPFTSSDSSAQSNVYQTLEHQALLLQARRDLRASEAETVVGVAREVEQAERELLWGRVDDLSERVRRLARLRGEGLASSASQSQQQREGEPEQDEKGRTRSGSRSSSSDERSLNELPVYSKEHDRQSMAHLPPGYYADMEVVDGKHGDEKEQLKDDWDVKPPKSPSLRSPQTLAAAAFASTSSASQLRKVPSLLHPSLLHPEKMQRDLDNVTSAIERLYIVSPQLANQRVEPDRRLQRERQLAKLGNAIERLSQGRLEDQRAVPSPVIGDGMGEGDVETKGESMRKEQVALDRLLDQIDKAASRTLADQRVELNGKRKEVLNADTANPSFSAADKYEARRREYILSHTGRGRLAGQDAILQPHYASGSIEPLFPPPPAELNQPVTISEFFAKEVEESKAVVEAGDEAMRARSQSAPLISVDEGAAAGGTGGVKKKFSSRTLFQPRPGTPGEVDDATAAAKKGSLRLGVFKKGAGVTGSGLGMLRRSSYDATGMTGLGVFGTGMSRSASAASEVEVLAIPQFDWITEESRNLGTLVVTFWRRSTSTFPRDEEFEVLGVEAESILVAPSRTGGPASRLSLPCRVVPQQATVSFAPDSGTYEVKLVTSKPSPTMSRADLEVHTPLSTDELRRSMPTSFACSTCDSTLADTASIKRYNALPSEHWAELLDAWMCHQDQELSADLIAKGKGIKPRADEALVGTTYVLLPREVTKNWKTREGSEPTRSPSDDLLHPAYCATCSSLIGSHVMPLSLPASSTAESTSFRLLKYATYPYRDGPTDDTVSYPPPRYSLASFLTAEMLETGQAHACHRFVVEEAETEEAKLLLWFFNPAVRLSFSTSSAPVGEILCNSANSAPSPSSSSIDGPPSSTIFSPPSPSQSPNVDKSALASTSRSMNAVKIFYSIVSSSNDSRCVEFTETQSTETVSYPANVVGRLVDLLKASTEVYPAAKRRFGEMDVGFLERI
ncbi:hypothetical protein JCM11251_001576 [Rhodosporidiobolus azoricus]